jgi:hypothetical protein
MSHIPIGPTYSKGKAADEALVLGRVSAATGAQIQVAPLSKADLQGAN